MESSSLPLLILLTFSSSSAASFQFPLMNKPVDIGDKRVWGRLFRGTGEGHNENLAQEFEFARRFARLTSQDPESGVADEDFQINEDDLDGLNEVREKPATSSELFKNIRKELDSIVSSNPRQFLPEMNEVDDGPIFQKSSRGDPKKRRKVTFIRRIPNGRFLRSPPRLARELLGDVGELELEELQELSDLTEQAVWAKVGNGRVKIFPLSFGPSNKILRIRKRKTKARELSPLRQFKAELPTMKTMEEEMKEAPIIIDMFTSTEDTEDSTEKVRLGEDGSLHISLLRY